MPDTLRDRLQASLGDNYSLERKLGSGGTATVYLAVDRRHRRHVAIKALHPDIATVLGPERFLREIETTARLRHPHILPLFDSGDAEGTLFYVMPFIDGESLRQRLRRDGALPVAEAVRLGREIGEALSYAHGRGVIHRDVKPENVLIDNGHAIVADFGIARAIWSADNARLTHTGVALGTPLYMSPEQAFSEGAVDARSDQYSLACVVYEMLVGHAPFSGDGALSILMRHLQDPLPPLASIRSDIPDHVAYAVERALAKAPADRFETLAEWLKALEGDVDQISAKLLRSRIDPGKHATPELTIGVEPFATGAGDSELQSIADGLADDIAVGLSLFPYLTVVRGSTVGPQYVMEGRVRRAGMAVRVTVQVLDRRSGEQLWGETYDRDLATSDAFAVVDAVTDRVVATVADPYGVLVRSITRTASLKPIADLTPYEAVLLYYYFHQRPAPDTHLAAREALEHAVEREPRNAAAWACLTHLYLDEDRHGFNPRPDSLSRALAAARRAIDADPTSAPAHHALAEAHFFRGDIGGFRSAAERAIALNRRDGAAVAMLGNLMATSGDWGRGVQMTTDAMANNPHHPGWYYFAAFFDHFRRGKFDEALATAERINMPGYFFSLMVLAVAHASLGNDDAARVVRAELVALVPSIDQVAAGFATKWLRWQPEVLARFIDGLQRAQIIPPNVPVGGGRDSGAWPPAVSLS